MPSAEVLLRQRKAGADLHTHLLTIYALRRPLTAKDLAIAFHHLHEGGIFTSFDLLGSLEWSPFLFGEYG